MKCNCNNINGGALEKPKISHVYGNVLRIAIPLTLRTVEKINDELVATDTEFIPSNEYPVKVVFAKSALRYSLDATMNGNIAYIEDKGKIPLGTYDITVTCNDDNGNPYRFNQATVLQVVNSTREAGIVSPVEYEVTTWYLDAAIYLALKGEDGVGIDDIRTETSDEIGGVNTVTIYLTDGRTKTFTVMNGSGSVDNILNILSHHPISNSAVTAKFNEIDERLRGLFGDVDYDSQSKQIRFWNKDKTSVLASLDARPFIKDGMVSNVYISNNTLVITFNTDSGREAIGVPLSSVFNPNNYYTKVQVDNRLASLIENYYTKTQIDNKLSDKASINGDWVQDFTASCFKLWCTERNDGLAVKIDADVDHSPDSAFIVFIDEYNYGGRLIYVFPQDTETRHIATEEYVQEYVSEHGDDGDSLVQVQSDWNQTDTSAVDYIKNKPTIPVVPTNVSSFTNDAGYLTQHQSLKTVNGTSLLGSGDLDVHELVFGQLSNGSFYKLVPAHGMESGGRYTLSQTAETPDGKTLYIDVSTHKAYHYNNTYQEIGAVDLSGYVLASALATVATSGSYNDLINKPSIPATQVQSDWNESDSSSKAYIANKPTIPTAYDDTALAGRVTTLENSKVTSVTVNGTNHTPTNGVVDLGTIQGGDGASGFTINETSTALVLTVWDGATVNETSTSITIQQAS